MASLWAVFNTVTKNNSNHSNEPGPVYKRPQESRYLDGAVLRAVRADLSDAVLKPVKLWFVPGVRAVYAEGYGCDYHVM